MTDREINIKLAKFAGCKPRLLWKYDLDSTGEHWAGGYCYKEDAERNKALAINDWLLEEEIKLVGVVHQYEDWGHIPDYCNDISEMYDFEYDYCSDYLDKYLDLLIDKCAQHNYNPAFATARHRAECAVSVLGL